MANPLTHHRPHTVVSMSAGPGESGTGTIGTAAGVAAFLVLLLFAVQLMVNLYAASTVTAAGYDAARVVASRRVDHSNPLSVASAQAEAEARFHQLVGRAGESAELTWIVSSTTVELRVLVDTPTILPSEFGPVAFGRVDRTFVVRTETLQ